MPSVLEVILKARDELSPSLRGATNSLDAFINKASSGGRKAAAAFGELANAVDKGSTAARVGLGGISQLAGGAETELGSLASKAAQTADAIGDTVSSIKNLGAAGFGLAGVSLIIAEWGAVAERTRQRLDSVAEPFDKIAEKIRAMDQVSATDNLAASIGKTAKEFDALLQSSRTAREEVLRYIEAEKEIAILREKSAIVAQSQADTYGLLNRAASEGLRFDDIKTFYDGLITALQNGVGVTGNFSGVLADLEGKQRTAAAAAGEHANALLGLASAAGEAGRELQKLGGEAGASVGKTGQEIRIAGIHAERSKHNVHDLRAGLVEFGNTTQVVTQGVSQWNANMRMMDSASNIGSAAMSRAAAAAQAAAQQFKSLVESALTPTAADPSMGNAWDEARKRFEAFASGTDTSAYGEDFKKMFDSLGMSAAEAARKFKDFSLFANPEMLKKGLIDFAPIVADVEQQLLSMAGKANVTAAAMKEVWKNLSPEAKAALAAQGIDSSTEAIQAMLDPAGKAQKEVSALSSAIGGIPTSVTTVFAILKNDTFDTDLKDILDAVAKIPTSIEIAVSLQNGIPTTDNSAGGSQTQTGGVNAQGLATGGYAAGGLYVLGEEGREYVLPHRMVKYIEGILGGRIRSPDQIIDLIGKINSGALQVPAQAQNWFKNIQIRDTAVVGLADVGASAGGGASAGAGGMGGDPRILQTLQSMDATLKVIATLLSNGSGPALSSGQLPANWRDLLGQLSPELSRSFGRRIMVRSALRKEDMLVRYGGEEFLVMLPDVPGPGAVVVAGRIRRYVANEPIEVGGEKFAVTVSLGVAARLDEGPESIDTLLGRADSALALAKERGRNRVVALSLGRSIAA